jgi:hypothetical protein
LFRADRQIRVVTDAAGAAATIRAAFFPIALRGAHAACPVRIADGVGFASVDRELRVLAVGVRCAAGAVAVKAILVAFEVAGPPGGHPVFALSLSVAGLECATVRGEVRRHGAIWIDCATGAVTDVSITVSHGGTLPLWWDALAATVATFTLGARFSARPSTTIVAAHAAITVWDAFDLAGVVRGAEGRVRRAITAAPAATVISTLPLFRTGRETLVCLADVGLEVAEGCGVIGAVGAHATTPIIAAFLAIAARRACLVGRFSSRRGAARRAVSFGARAALGDELVDDDALPVLLDGARAALDASAASAREDERDARGSQDHGCQMFHGLFILAFWQSEIG